MDLETAARLPKLHDRSHESTQFVAHHLVLILLEERVAMEFDKDPIGSAFHSDVRALPTPEAIHFQRVIACERAVVESWHWKTTNSPGPIKHQRPIDDYRESWFITHF
jgi:hypothetical protein